MNKDQLKEIIQISKQFPLLYVEDSEDTRQSTMMVLEEFFDNIIVAVDGQDALQKLQNNPHIKLVLSDINMPVLNGIEMLRIIRETNEDLPVIFLSAHEEAQLFIQSIELGVDAFVIKPLKLQNFANTIKKTIEKLLLKQELQRYHESLEDKIFERTKELEYELMYDSLTGLLSRHTFTEDLKKQPDILFVFDIKKFKIINELYGNNIGSIVLQEFAKFLHITFNNVSLKIYRLSADEFALLGFDGCINENNYEVFINTFFDDFYNFEVLTHDLSIGMDACVGISTSKKGDMHETAKIALEHAKDTRVPYCVFNNDIDTRKELSDLMLWRKKILYAIAEKNIIAVYQPIVNHQQEVIKHEALVRMRDVEQNRLISPFFFLELSASLGLYNEISNIVIFNALLIAKKHNTTISINVTYNDIKNDELVEKLESFFKQNPDLGKKIVFEITEDESLENYQKVKNFILTFKGYGCQIAIDDFGTGFSNFQHIIELHPDYLKIDGSLIKSIDTDPKAFTLVEAIVKFSHELEIKVIAEYVHSQTIFDLLCELKIDEYQGFYFSEPKEHI